MRFTRCAGLTYVILDNNLASHESAFSLQDLASEVGALIHSMMRSTKQKQDIGDWIQDFRSLILHPAFFPPYSLLNHPPESSILNPSS